MADPRIAAPSWFRAEGAVLQWSQLFANRLKQADQLGIDQALLARLREAAAKRPLEVHLRWACSARLGVPRGPFTVWARSPKDAPRPVDVRSAPAAGGVELRWGFAASIIEVDCLVSDATRAVALLATRWGGSLRETIAAAAMRAPAGGRVTLRVRCAGATRAVLINASNTAVRVQPLQETLDDAAWKPVEIVGLPVDTPWADTAYRADQQGLVAALTDPVTAALQRLARGGPPLGWFFATEFGRAAPPWRAPDPAALVKEVRTDLLPRIARLYRPALLPPDQGAVIDSPPVDPPQSGGRTSTLAARADLPPLALLTLPTATDPFLALATGFGTAYPVERAPVAVAVVFQQLDFLVTADYEETPLRRGKATVAAYVPAPGPHGAMPSPTTLTAERSGILAPDVRDGPWRETVRVSWDRPPTTAALGRASGAVVARYPAASGVAECLLPVRAAGDFRPLLIVPDGADGAPNHDRSAMVDAAAVIPLGSGGRNVGYAAAVQDVFGVWSRWEDVPYTGTEPAPPLPRVLALALTSSYAGSTACPATLEIELSVDWADRTPTRVEVAAVFFPLAGPAAPPPASALPVGPPPAGGFRRDFVLPFIAPPAPPALPAEQLSAPPGGTVEHLNGAGDGLAAPGPLQGDQGRRYRLRIPIPTLDFGATRWWGVQVWLRTGLAAFGGAPTTWSPDATRPAVTRAASPVPVAPLPPPLPPGVPLGSTPDAAGCSHAQVRWSLPAGADVAKVVLWEVAETALRQAAAAPGVPPRAAEGTLPGVRLQTLRDLYNALPAGRRRAAFRRMQELPGTARTTDVALPKGSTDIHLFTVTTVTSTGVESPWPGGPVPHEHLQAVAAPRLRRPVAPRVRALVGVGGSVALSLTAPSRVPVREFRLYRTRSAEAARSFETMGPAFAVVPAALVPGLPDPATRERSYSASWTGPFAASWDEWFVRAVAVPEDVVSVEAVRGLPSPACEPISLTILPEDAPDLAPLTAEVWGAAHDGLLVHTSTAAPARVVALGSHKLSGSVTTPTGGTQPVALVALDAVPVGATAVAGPPPAGVAVAPVLVHAPRAGGRTPLALWCTRPVAGEAADVVLRLVDPMGRVTEQHLTVPGWVPPAPPAVTLDLLDVTKIPGRGAVLRLRSDAPIDAAPPYVLEVSALSRMLRPPRPPFLRPRPVTASFPLNAIRRVPPPFPPTDPIQVLRTTDRPPHEYQLLVRLVSPFGVTATLVSPTGERKVVTAEVRA